MVLYLHPKSITAKPVGKIHWFHFSQFEPSLVLLSRTGERSSCVFTWEHALQYCQTTLFLLTSMAGQVGSTFMIPPGLSQCLWVSLCIFKPESIILNALCKNVRTGKRNFEFMTSLWTKFPKWTYFLHKCPNTQVRRVIYLTLQIVFPDIIKSILTYFSRAQWELTRPTFMLWRWSFRLLLSSSVSQCSLLARRENRFITNNDPVAN